MSCIFVFNCFVFWLLSAFLVVCVYVCAQSCLTLCGPMDYSSQGSSVHEIFQARILEYVAIPFSRGWSWPEIEHASLVSPALAGRFFTCLKRVSSFLFVLKMTGAFLVVSFLFLFFFYQCAFPFAYFCSSDPLLKNFKKLFFTLVLNLLRSLGKDFHFIRILTVKKVSFP